MEYSLIEKTVGLKSQAEKNYFWFVFSVASKLEEEKLDNIEHKEPAGIRQWQGRFLSTSEQNVWKQS